MAARASYTYIPDSLRQFCFHGRIFIFAAALRICSVDTRSYILGGIGLHWAAKKQ